MNTSGVRAQSMEGRQSLPTVLRIDNINEVSSALSRLASKRTEKLSYPDEKIPIIQYDDSIDKIILGISTKREEEDKEWKSRLEQRFQRSSPLKVTEVNPEIIISMNDFDQDPEPVFPEEPVSKRKHFTRRVNKTPLNEKGFGMELFEPTD